MQDPVETLNPLPRVLIIGGITVFMTLESTLALVKSHGVAA